jgi:hypothetical protein
LFTIHLIVFISATIANCIRVVVSQLCGGQVLGQTSLCSSVGGLDKDNFAIPHIVCFCTSFLMQVHLEFGISLVPTRLAILLIVPWLTCLRSYLITVPDVVKQLSGLYLMVDNRLTNYNKLLKLQGRLDLLLSQVCTCSAHCGCSRSVTNRFAQAALQRSTPTVDVSRAVVYREDEEENANEEDEEVPAKCVQAEVADY